MFAHKMVLLHQIKPKVDLLRLVKMKTEIRMKVYQFTELIVKIIQICAFWKTFGRVNIGLKTT